MNQDEMVRTMYALLSFARIRRQNEEGGNLRSYYEAMWSMVTRFQAEHPQPDQIFLPSDLDSSHTGNPETTACRVAQAAESSMTIQANPPRQDPIGQPADIPEEELMDRDDSPVPSIPELSVPEIVSSGGGYRISYHPIDTVGMTWRTS